MCKPQPNLWRNLQHDLMSVNISFNTLECKTIHKFEGGRVVTYGYSIELDRQGIEVTRTEPEPISSIGWDDGRPFMEEDYYHLSKGMAS